MRLIAICATWICLVAAPAQVTAAPVELPLFLRVDLLQRALANYLFPQPNQAVTLFQEGPYRYLHAEQPRFYIRNGQPHFACHAAASMGVELLGVWPVGVAWSGSIDLTLQPFMDPQWKLRYRVVDSTMYDDKGVKPAVTGYIWDLSKRFLHPRLETFSFDLAMPQKEIVDLLRSCASPDDTAQLDAALRTMTAGTLVADAAGIVVPLALSVTDSGLQAPLPTPQAPLSPEEVETFQQALEPWDAFLVFVIKSAGAEFVDREMRDQLFDLLLTSRYELLPILAGEAAVNAGDPLRALFADAWQQMRIIIEGGEKRGLVQEKMLRYMTFINAGDALLALDKAAPGLGMRLSTDGLRQLARTLQPDVIGDPLGFNWEVDPALREMFQFAPEPEPGIETITFKQRLLDLLIARAWAEETETSGVIDLNKRLDRWVPAAQELDEYQPLVARLLKVIADEELARGGLEPRYAAVYQNLVPTTALIESCWRQYVRTGDKVSFLYSQAGSVGIMQINQHVWRGFYNVERLRWDVAYNTQAGAQILMRYLKQYAIAVGDKTGNPNNAARATYSIYNAGPRAVHRFMNPKSTPREKHVDERLWGIYQGVAVSGAVDLTTCRAASPSTPEPGSALP
ncbi:MAG: hypothetical protein AUK28_10740 [Desulfobacterales bacterium CG2_30_60_27]|nr:MAG: hypothetical protein AUK28_10740 [Desulfobacterales bacterium CG2_30_60_27]